MSIDISKQLTVFQENISYLKNLHKNPIAETVSIKEHSKVLGCLNEIEKKICEKLESWKTPAEGFFNSIPRVFTREKPKKAASAPYVFKNFTDNEKKELTKKADFHRTCFKVLVIAGAILAIGGLLGPFGMLPVLFVIPETLAAAIIFSSTAFAGAGAAALAAASILQDSKRIKEERVGKDINFKCFVNHVIQNPKLFNFNISEADLFSREIHRMYCSWKKDMEKLFKEKNITLLKKELQAGINFADLSHLGT